MIGSYGEAELSLADIVPIFHSRFGELPLNAILDAWMTAVCGTLLFSENAREVLPLIDIHVPGNCQGTQ